MEFLAQIQNVLDKYAMTYVRGAGMTVLLATVGTIVGCFIGFAVGILQTIPEDKTAPWPKRMGLKFLKVLLRIYVEVFRGTPMICQAVFIYYGGMQMFGWNLDILTAGLLVVSINTGAYMAETVRGGIMAIDPGQTEGAKAIGMTHFQTMLYVIFPQTFRNIIPQIGNNFIINIKDTSVLSVISVSDLFYAHKTVVGALYLYFPSATIVMAIYLTMTLISSYLLRLWEAKLSDHSSFELVTEEEDHIILRKQVES